MRVGFLSKFDPERIGFMKQHGFGSVELLAGPDDTFVPGHDGWQEQAERVKNAYAREDIRISCIGGFYVNHMDADPRIARKHAEYVRNVITLARFMDVPVVAGFAGRVLNEDLEQSVKPFQAIWSEHARFAEDHGIRIAFEHCPMGRFHGPFGGINCICTPLMWERCFEAVPSAALGLEWDPSHLVGQFIDPIMNIRHWGQRVYHVHAKDAHVYRHVLEQYGIYHWGAIEHCFPGLGDCDWGLLIKELRRMGYHGDLNIEGWHDTVFNSHHDDRPRLEDTGLLIALRHLTPFVDGV